MSHNVKFNDFNYIFETVAGSHLYGTAKTESDVDVRGVFIPTEPYFYGFMLNIEQIEEKEPHDKVLYDIRKFCKLASECNPNIVELLFVPKSRGFMSDYPLLWTDEWQEIHNNRHIFLSTRARHTFTGYAVAQLKRIKQHRNWLLHPPKSRPKRSDFGLPDDRKLVTEDQYNAFKELNDEYDDNLIDLMELDINAMNVLQREKAFRNANKNWGQYENWKKQRNPQRAELEAKYGYDTKHASHLVRLISEGKELLLTGEITLPRPDAAELLRVRGGEYSYDELMDKIGDLDAKFDEYEENSCLPYKSNVKACDKLCQEIVKRSIR